MSLSRVIDLFHVTPLDLASPPAIERRATGLMDSEHVIVVARVASRPPVEALSVERAADGNPDVLNRGSLPKGVRDAFFAGAAITPKFNVC